MDVMSASLNGRLSTQATSTRDLQATEDFDQWIEDSLTAEKRAFEADLKHEQFMYYRNFDHSKGVDLPLKAVPTANLGVFQLSGIRSYYICEVTADNSEALSAFEERNIAQLKDEVREKYSRTLEINPDTPPSASNFASIDVFGDPVALIDNSGRIHTSPELASKFESKLAAFRGRDNGPNLARTIADQFASHVGGSVVMQLSAMTQAEYEVLMT